MPRARWFCSRVAGSAALCALLGTVTLGCKEKPAATQELSRAQVEPVLAQYADIAWASYSDSVAAARELERAVTTLVDQPSAASLEGARQAWIRSRLPYLQTEAFRFYDGPIERFELLINTWPIDEEYLEASDGTSGVVRDTAKYPELSQALLTTLNLKEGETSVSTGFHAIEFLLWGRDTSIETAGTRSFIDYSSAEKAIELASARLPAPQGLAPTAPELDSTKTDHNDAATARRRGAYLKLASSLLVQHLSEVAMDWAPAVPGNYRARFLALEPRAALLLMVKGAGSLSGAELSGERLTVPYETKDQENEHSCFSDTTHTDVVYDSIGIKNVLLGSYQRTDGSVLKGRSIRDLVRISDPALALELERAITDGEGAARAIPPPFDRAIQGTDDAPGRVAVKRAIVSFQKLTTTLDAVAAKLGLSAAHPVAK